MSSSTAKTIVITGASDGIGAATARQLTAEGHHVVVVGRSPGKTRDVAAEIGSPFYLADYTDLAQVRDLAGKLAADHPKIDVLVNNAGGVFGERALTTDGFEKTFQVNHLAPFLLTQQLLPLLTSSHSTVINTSSSAAKNFGDIDIEDLQNEKNYSPNKAYGDAKLANILFTAELQRRHGAQGINAAAIDPGNVATNFASDTTSWFRFMYQTPLKHVVLISPTKAAGRITFLVNNAPGVAWQPGTFLAKDTLASKTNPQGSDTQLAARLWERSEAMVSPRA